MNLLHRYLLREILGATLAAVALFAFVLLTGSAIKDLVGLVADGKMPLATSVELIVMLLPFVLTYALPLGLLTAILLTLGRISAQNEVTAMRAAGIGLTRIGAPALLVAVLGAAACLVINFSYAPNAKAKYRERLADAARTNPTSFLVERTFIRQFPGAVIYFTNRDGNTLRDIWVWEVDENHRVQRFHRAASGNFRWDEAENYLSLVLERVVTEWRNQQNPEDFSKPPYNGFLGQWPIRLPLDQLFKRTTFTKKISWMDLRELLAERQRLKPSKEEADLQRLVQVEMSIHEKAALGFSVLSFAIVGVPLGIRTRRVETSANLGLALVLTMGYFVMTFAASWLEAKPHLHPELLLWLPNVAFQALGGWLWWRLGRN